MAWHASTATARFLHGQPSLLPMPQPPDQRHGQGITPGVGRYASNRLPCSRGGGAGPPPTFRCVFAGESARAVAHGVGWGATARGQQGQRGTRALWGRSGRWPCRRGVPAGRERRAVGVISGAGPPRQPSSSAVRRAGGDPWPRPHAASGVARAGPFDSSAQPCGARPPRPARRASGKFTSGTALHGPRAGGPLSRCALPRPARRPPWRAPWPSAGCCAAARCPGPRDRAPGCAAVRCGGPAGRRPWRGPRTRSGQYPPRSCWSRGLGVGERTSRGLRAACSRGECPHSQASRARPPRPP